ncbi:carboxypeptidase regulatory-like domain-containing protein [Flavobacterium sp.]|uniref:carboxypeptidase regulatory-like domain-containing protein n=1 Tax=Flavobacterium sp. TaxID=239 RepID=UPI0025B9869E|nr:carboxypeptidase regulatory-like domain-containing protein [Flavobacterium sp.]
MNMSDTLCRDYCQQVHDETTVLLPLLTTYLVTTGELDDLQRAIDKFWEWVSKPRNSISERRVSTTNLAEAFAVCADKMTSMDIHMRMLETSHPELYMNYIYRRKLVTPSYRKLSLRGVVQGGLGELLSGVTVKIGTLNVETITTDKGYFEFKSLPPGVYMASYELEGYETQSQPVAIVANERRDVKIELTEENRERNAS